MESVLSFHLHPVLNSGPRPVWQVPPSIELAYQLPESLKKNFSHLFGGLGEVYHKIHVEAEDNLQELVLPCGFWVPDSGSQVSGKHPLTHCTSLLDLNFYLFIYFN